jgi:hypothetical protein
MKENSDTQRVLSTAESSSSLYFDGQQVSNKGNNFQQGMDNVQVFIRIRPMNSLELKSNKAIHVLSENTIQVQTPDQTKGQPGPKKDPLMTFHGVSDDSSQEYIFQNCGVQSLLDRCLEGYNATVFAFGQTGCII